MKTLILKSVHTTKRLGHLMTYLRQDAIPCHLRSLHIENCGIKRDYVVDIIRSLRYNKFLKRLSLVNLNGAQTYLRTLYKSLKLNNTLEHLSLANNEIFEYE